MRKPQMLQDARRTSTPSAPYHLGSNISGQPLLPFTLPFTLFSILLCPPFPSAKLYFTLEGEKNAHGEIKQMNHTLVFLPPFPPFSPSTPARTHYHWCIESRVSCSKKKIPSMPNNPATIGCSPALKTTLQNDKKKRSREAKYGGTSANMAPPTSNVDK